LVDKGANLIELAHSSALASVFHTNRFYDSSLVTNNLKLSKIIEENNWSNET